MSGFKPYPAYKDSGVEWLGEVPVGWAVHPLKRAIERIESGTSVNAADHPAEPGSFGVLKTSCVYTGQFDWTENKTVNDEDLIRVSCPVKKNTLIVSRMNTPELVGATGLVTEAPEGIFLPDRLWQVYFTDNHSPSFLFYFTKSHEYREQVKMACSGTSASMQNLGQDDFRGLLFAEPSKSEQFQIARFLDHETARIDALIEEQQRLIELLKEKRQAVISHAVTKGLDPTVPMKDSGVEWLGEVPAHWVVAQLKFSAMEMQTGPFGSQLHAEDYIDSGIPLINPAHMIEGKIIHDPRVTVDEQTWRRLKRHALAAGDMIFARRGELGRCAIVTEGQEGWLCGTGSLKVKLGKQLDAEYAYLLITSPGVVSELSLESKGSTMENLNTETLGRIRLPLPPVNEQKAILEHVNNVAGQFGELIYTAENGIRLMVERRSALISAAVTGKIDVRNWQPPAGHYPVGDTQNRTEPEVV